VAADWIVERQLANVFSKVELRYVCKIKFGMIVLVSDISNTLIQDLSRVVKCEGQSVKLWAVYIDQIG
jgi:hypothetical protein